jgi:hypothetical protein
LQHDAIAIPVAPAGPAKAQRFLHGAPLAVTGTLERRLDGEGHMKLAALAVASSLALCGAAHAASFTGTITVSFSISLLSEIDPSTAIQCAVSVSVVSINTAVAPAGVANTVIEQGSVGATRTGNSATCAVAIPYLWNNLQGSENATISYTVSTVGTTVAALARTSGQTIAVIALPKNGTPTSFNVNVDL